jgi:hypothetical protein
MQQILDSIPTAAENDSDNNDSALLEDDVPWIREPTPAERRELERVQRLIARR